MTGRGKGGRRGLIAGHATSAGTEAYARSLGAGLAAGHYSEFDDARLRLSSLGVGTFPGAADDETDEAVAGIVARAACAGINVFDTAAHYRHMRAPRALGEGLRRAFAAGVARDQVFVVAKGGFLAFPEGRPDDLGAWFEREIVARGLGRREELSGLHLASPAHLAWQIEAVRRLTGLATLDAFLVDQPEVHIPAMGKEAANRLLLGLFVVLEQAVKSGRIRCYGISTFDAFRVETDHALFQSLASLLGLAGKAARQVWGEEKQHGGAGHHFRVAQLPFNQAMAEGFTRFSQATGQGNIASTVQAARQLGVYLMASHGLMKGRLAGQCADAVREAMPGLANDARRAMQFNRSTPGIGTVLTGLSTPEHLGDLLAVAGTPPLTRERYLGFYRRTESA